MKIEYCARILRKNVGYIWLIFPPTFDCYCLIFIGEAGGVGENRADHYSGNEPYAGRGKIRGSSSDEVYV